jgi:hypothetical protein
VRFLRRVPDSERIPARNESDAEKRFSHAMNMALGLVTRSTQWRASRPRHRDGLWTLLLEEDPAPFPCDAAPPVLLSAYLLFEFERDQRESHVGGMKVITREYIYSLRTAPEEEAELITWHWHPAVKGAPHPHVHVRADREDVPGLRDMHIPTSRVFFEDVLLFAIENLSVTCRQGGQDSLRESLRRTRNWASWR